MGGTAKRIDYKETFLYFDDGDDDDDGALQRELIAKRLFSILMMAMRTFLMKASVMSPETFYLKTIANEQHPTFMMCFNISTVPT